MRPPLAALLACAALALASGAGAAGDPYAALLAPAGTCGQADSQLNLDAATARIVMTCLTNYARSRAGLPPLQANAALNAAGDAKLAADVSCGDFSHTPCDKPFESVFATYLQGASSYSVGENIAWGTGSYGTPRQTMSSWLHSTAHRENILRGSFTEIGIGYLSNQTFQGFAGISLWSQEFGTRSPSAARTTPRPVVRRGHRRHPRSG